MRDKLPLVERQEWCIGCGHCGAVCPVEAVFQRETAVESRHTVGPTPSVTPEALQQLFRERRSIRSYRSQPVPRDVLEKIINAGRYTPTGSNSQNVHYLVLSTPEEIARLRELTLSFLTHSFKRVGSKTGAFVIRLMAGRKTLEQLQDYRPQIMDVLESTRQGEDRILYHAPAVIIVHAPAWDPSSAFNCSTAIYNCSLMAHSLGLGVCFNGFVEGSIRHYRKLKQWLALPRGHHCLGAMTLGYPEVKFSHLVERRPPPVTWR
jgi:nitroreductase